MIIELQEWVKANDALIVKLTIASLVMFVGTLTVIPIVVSRMSADYFMPVRDDSRADRHPFARLSGLVMKNVLGLVLVLMGIVMIFIPGQGLLTILFGVVLLDFPGKRNFELWLVKKKPVQNSINWIRRKAKKEPLILPKEETAEEKEGG